MKNLFTLTFLFISTALSQDYTGYHGYYFLGRTPSAQIDAMGRGGVALHGNPNSAYFNPANIGTIKSYMLSYTNSSPLLAKTKSQVNYFSAAFPLKGIGTIALSYHHLDSDTKYSVGTIDELNIKTVEHYIYSSSLTYAYSYNNDFHIALTGTYNSEDNGLNFSNLTYDIGFLYLINTSDITEFSFALSVKNMFNQKFESDEKTILNLNNGEDRTPYYIGYDEIYFPVQMRIGLAYKNEELLDEIISEVNTFGLLVHSEFQTIFNSDYYNAFRFGMELNLFETILLRTGYFYQTLNDNNEPKYNNDYVDDYTFGFGLHLDFNKYFELPFMVKIDYTSLEQDENKNYAYRGKLDNYNVISLGLKLVID